MSIDRDLASICKELRLLGERDLAKKALCAYAAITDSEKPHVDLSYTYVMRELRKKDDDKRKVFQKSFKEAFDKALYADIDEPAEIALMAAIKASGFKEEDDA